MNKKLLSVAVTISLVLSFLVAIPAGAGIVGPPLPEDLWSYNTTGDVTDIAVGDLDGDGKDDVVAIELSLDTLTAISGEGPGDWYWQDTSIAGFAVAVGDINGDGWNEVIAGGGSAGGMTRGGTLEGGYTKFVMGDYMIKVYDKDGTILWSYPVTGEVKDIEIGDVDGDGIDDIVACNNVVANHIYAIDGTGHDITGLWPITPPTPVVDLAIGQLDGQAGVDVAAIGGGVACLYVYNSAGSLIWSDSEVGGRTVEIGDVDGDGDNEVVAITYDSGHAYAGGLGRSLARGTVIDGGYGGWVLAFDGIGDGAGNSELLYSFYTEDGKIITDIELGDLDGNPADVEVAAITEPVDETLFAIDIAAEQEMWRYSIDWPAIYYGESLAIGDIDRDYKNEVVAASSEPTHCVYALDGIDRDGDGQGDLVWSPYCVWDAITDVEIGDLDGDGDDDVTFGTVGGLTIYAIKAVESETATATGTGTAYFDADPSILDNLTPVSESELPEEGKPDLEFPHGFFSFDITLPAGHTTAIVTMTFPSPLPVGTQYWKYGPTPSDPTDHWYQLLVGDNDGDNVITITLVDGGLGDDNVVAPDGMIIDQGAPGFSFVPVGGEAHTVNKLAILAPWIALAAAIIAGATIFMRRRRVQR
jgi:hypothetical protein